MSSHSYCTVDLMCFETNELRKAINDRTLREDKRILGNLLEHEERYIPQTSYFNFVQDDIKPYMRKMAAQWMLEVCEECGCEEDVFHLAMNYMDRFLCVKKIQKTSLQLLGAACMFVASKLKETNALTADKLVAYTDNSITHKQLLEYESTLLQTLRWDVSATTPLDFLTQILNRMIDTMDARTLALVKCHAQTFIALCATDSKFMLNPPSMMACGCVVVACKGLGLMEENTILQYLHRITKIELDCLQECHENIEQKVKADLESLSPSNNPSTGKGDSVQQPTTPTEVQSVAI